MASSKSTKKVESTKYLQSLEKLLADSDEELSEDEQSDIECDPCSKIFSSAEEYQKHLKSKKHHKVLVKLRSLEKLGNNAPKKKSSNDPNDSSDSSESIWCEVCDKEMSGLKSYLAHMNGSIHAKNLKQSKLREKVKGMKIPEGDLLDAQEEDETLQKPFARCLACCKTLYGPEAYQQHMKGVNHKKKLKQMNIVEALKKDDAADNDEDDSYTKCQVCNKAFSGPVPYQVHLLSAAHRKGVLRAEAEKELKDKFDEESNQGKFVCKECKKVFPDALSFKSHIENNNHEKQKVKDAMFGFVASNPDIVAMKSVQNVSSDEGDGDKETVSYRPGQYFLVCKLCHVTFSGPESAQDHLESKKHLKNKIEKTQKKALKEMLKEKQNGHPVIRHKATPSGSVALEKKAKTPKINGTKDMQDDFELI